jgi:RNA polymerase sigma factor (sigma-70 family)
VRTEKYDHITDNELLEQFYADRDNKWLGVLLQRYTLLLLGVCMKYLRNEEDARDSVQHVFLKAIAELHKYKVEYFKSWIYMVAKNHCLMRIRDSQGKNPTELTDRMIGTIEIKEEDKNWLEHERTYEFMEESLNELNHEQQQCVTLFYLDKMSYQEIAEKTGYSMMQVKSYIQNGKRNLRIMIEKKLNEVNNRREP